MVQGYLCYFTGTLQPLLLKAKLNLVCVPTKKSCRYLFCAWKKVFAVASFAIEISVYILSTGYWGHLWYIYNVSRHSWKKMCGCTHFDCLCMFEYSYHTVIFFYVCSSWWVPWKLFELEARLKNLQMGPLNVNVSSIVCLLHVSCDCLYSKNCVA